MTARGGERAPHLSPAQPPRPATIALEDAGATPILREYRAVKEQHPDAILLARLGDFFEMFGSDAETAAPLLGVTLTGRRFGNAGRLPMCGVPYHAAPQYIRRLLGAGHRVALWDQVGESDGGKLVQREVTRVLSAGTAVEPDLLDASATARCVALLSRGDRTGVAALDASTGAMELSEVQAAASAAAVNDELGRLEAVELVHPDGEPPPAELLPELPRTPLPSSVFDLERATGRVCGAAGVQTLATLDAEGMSLAVSAAGALLAYCERSRLAVPEGLLRVVVRHDDRTMRLDAQTRRNLELTEPLGAGGTSLVTLLDHTRTAAGGRLLRAWVQAPLLDAEAIATRSAAVRVLVDQRDARRVLSNALRDVADIERLVARAGRGTASPRDLAALRDSCSALQDVCESAMSCNTEGSSTDIRTAAAACTAPPELIDVLTRHLVDDPPPSSRDGGFIRPGVDAELDGIVAAGADAREFIATLEERERERTGIRSLRVGYNRVFGYYLEVPHAQQALVPSHYTRRQTLAGAERYVTAELKQHETTVLSARERASARERELLHTLMETVAASAGMLLDAAHGAATLDALQSLAAAAESNAWVQPSVDSSAVIDITAGRHPLVEHSLGRSRFVPNDCTLDAVERIVVLTGPNMAGKSTYLRQVAIIALLAQIGSHVPAESARLGVCDRIFTRIGAHDDLAGGMSTFMVEMAETAAILRLATPRSLVILDEIGRGTSTYDGLAIARAVIEHIHDAPQLNCRTLFATHFHELTELATLLPRVRNARVEVDEDGERITFLHRIVEGGADRSYGVHVAKLAGVPSSVLARARDLLHIMERNTPLAARADASSAQLDLALNDGPSHEVLSELVQLDLDTLSPLAALNKLSELQRRVTP